MTLGFRAAGMIVMLALLILGLRPALADLRSAPTWYDSNAVTTTPDWHYRVPINVPAGATLQVVATDPMSMIDMPHFCTEQGHTLLSHEQAGQNFHFRIRRK